MAKKLKNNMLLNNCSVLPIREISISDSREKSGNTGKILIVCTLLLIILGISQAANQNSILFDPTDIIIEEFGKTAPPPVNPAAKTSPDNVQKPAPTAGSTQTKIIIEEPIKQPAPQKQNPPKQQENVDVIIEEKPAVPSKQIKQAKQSVVKEKISAPVPSDDSQSSTALLEMIEKIRSIRFPSGRTLVEQFTQEKSPYEAKEKIVVADANTVEAQKQIAQFKPAEKSLISQETLKELQILIEKPQLTENPLLIAEILYLGGQKEQASIFYSEAIDRLKKQGALSIHDKAWLLLQTATCFKSYDGEKASKTYKEVLSECPSSNWAPIAKSQSDLLDWLDREKPYELIKQCRSELTMVLSERRVQ